MNDRIRKLTFAMIAFDRGEPELIQHFTKVHAYCRLIAACECLPDDQQEILEAAALVHDIAIPLCLKKYGDCSGPHQEAEGPDLVREMLPPIGFTPDQVERVCWLVAHHHTLTGITSLDHQILIEADFLVNSFESGHSDASRRSMLEKTFKTAAGKRILKEMFDL